MTDKLSHIDSLVADGRLEEAIALLDSLLAAEAEGADDLYFRRGKLHWRLGHTRQAITDYNAAVGLNPDSPARLALTQATAILDFYNTDLYNP